MYDQENNGTDDEYSLFNNWDNDQDEVHDIFALSAICV